MGELATLPNIGKTVEAQLIQVGITSVDELRRIGAKEAWLRCHPGCQKDHAFG